MRIYYEWLALEGFLSANASDEKRQHSVVMDFQLQAAVKGPGLGDYMVCGHPSQQLDLSLLAVL